MIVADKLKKGDIVRVITPARSISMPFILAIKEDAIKKFSEMGLELSFGKHNEEMDEFNSSSIESRIEDLHEAFNDDQIKLIITVIGGFNSNQLLRYIDYDLIKRNPKILCGYSDITALANAIYAKTGLVTYSGPHFFNFGDLKSFEYSKTYFEKCFFNSDPFKVEPSRQWSDDRWSTNQENRTFFDNEGYKIINEGTAEGIMIGGNLCTLNLLQGTEYMPSLKGAVLFIEDDSLSDRATFDRDLQSLIHQPDFVGVRGVAIGRFQKKSEVPHEVLVKIIKTKKELANLPVISNVDFGHTTPMITFPIGGTVRIEAKNDKVAIEIVNH